MARRKLQHTLLSANFSQVKFGGAKAEPEGTPEIFDVIQLPTLQSVIEACAETIGHEMGGDLDADLIGRRKLVSGGGS